MIFGIIGGANFVNTPVKSMKLEVPSSAVAAYRAAAGWNEFKSIVCISHSLNHMNTDAAYAKVPVTCTTDGTYYYSCSVCGEKSTNSTFTVAALQHDYSVMSTDEAYHKDDATCLSAATYWYKCSRCTAKSTKDFFTSTEDKDKALGHSYGEGVWSWKWDDEEHSATCTRTCTRTTCTDKTTGHTASAKVTQNNGIDDGELTEPATCTAMGTTTYTATATVENVEYKSTHEVADIAMLPHTFDQHVCTVCSADEEPAVTGTQGECTWRIYASDGEMIVSPTNGVSGSLGDWDETPSWYEQRTEIKSVRFTGSVTANTLYQVFHQCNNITSIDLTNLNTSQVQNMSTMFNQCHNLTTINWGSFDTSNATDISFMFNECVILTSLDLRCFNTSNVTLMNSVFQTCKNLTSVDLSSLNTDKVENFEAMFIRCDKLTNLDLSNFNTVNATNMNYMFEYCGELESLTIGNFDMSKVTTSNDMFISTGKLSTLTLTSVPYLKEGTFKTKFADKTVICKLDEKSTVYKGENLGFPTVTSVTAPCSLDLTGSAVADCDITRTHNMVNGSCTKCDFSIGDEVSYIDANGKQHTAKAIKLTADMEGDYVTSDNLNDYLAPGWYYVEDNLILNKKILRMKGDAEFNIILTDGCQWKIYNNCVIISDGATVNFYCQSKKSGTLEFDRSDSYISVKDNSTLNIYGGNFKAPYSVLEVNNSNLHIFDANVKGNIFNMGSATIDGGTFTGMISTNGTIIINGGTFKGDEYALDCEEKGVFTLNGGTFTGGVAAFRHNVESVNGNELFLLGDGKAFYDNYGDIVNLKFKQDDEYDDLFFSTLKTYIVRGTSSSDDDEPASISTLVKTIEKLKDPNSGVTIQTVNEIVDKLLGKEKQDGGNTEDLEEEEFIW